MIDVSVFFLGLFGLFLVAIALELFGWGVFELLFPVRGSRRK
jgi:hypothetical protein